MQKGLKQIIGNGDSIRVWTSPWICEGRKRAPRMKNIIVDLELLVSDLIDMESRTWDKAILEENFYQRGIDLILKMKHVVASDEFWYSVKSGWLFRSIKQIG